MPGIYERLGVRPIINARGTHTRLGGSLMEPEVLEAMRAAAGAFVVLDELQAVASRLIARVTGAEAGIVTGGAAAGLLLGTAACLAGNDPVRIERLPEVVGARSEAIMHRAHRNGYDHSVRAAGARIVDVGYAHATLPDQLAGAINERTALIVYLVSPWAARGALSIEQTCRIAREHGIPVLVDAAAALPPATNLTRFVDAGADLVVFSGGKAIGGPQSSGILAGRADLIASAVLNGSPRHSVGRAGKAAKEDIVGLMVALERYVARDHDADLARWREQAEAMLDQVSDFPGVTATYRYGGLEHHTPRVELVFDPATGIDAHELVVALEQQEPRVFLFEPAGPSARPNSVVINPHTMRPGEEAIVGPVVRSAIATRLAGRSGGAEPVRLLVEA
jgi:L-seryl-tRNA(Ser) seleniumtransferase